MSIRTVVTRGFGAGASIGAVVRRGYFPEAVTTHHRLKRGGHGRKDQREVTRNEVDAWWDDYDALVKRADALQPGQQQRAALASAEVVSEALSAIEGATEAPELPAFEAMARAMEAAARASSAARVVAEAEKAKVAARQIMDELKRGIQALEDEEEDNSVLLLIG